MIWFVWFAIGVCAVTALAEGAFWLYEAYHEWRMVRITANFAKRFGTDTPYGKSLARSAEELGKKAPKVKPQ